VGSSAARFDPQAFRHGGQLIEVDRTDAVFLVLDGFQHGVDPALLTAERNTVLHMVWHS